MSLVQTAARLSSPCAFSFHIPAPPRAFFRDSVTAEKGAVTSSRAESARKPCVVAEQPWGQDKPVQQRRTTPEPLRSAPAASDRRRVLYSSSAPGGQTRLLHLFPVRVPDGIFSLSRSSPVRLESFTDDGDPSNCFAACLLVGALRLSRLKGTCSLEGVQ